MSFRDLSQLDPLFFLRLLFQRDGPAQQVADSAVASALDNPVVRDALRYASYSDVPFDAVRVQFAPLVEDLRYGLSGYPSLEGTDQLTRQAADVRGFGVRVADQFASGQPYEPQASFGLVGDMVLDPSNWVVPGAGAAIRAGRALGLSDETAEHLAHALGLRRIADQTMETVEMADLIDEYVNQSIWHKLRHYASASEKDIRELYEAEGFESVRAALSGTDWWVNMFPDEETAYRQLHRMLMPTIDVEFPSIDTGYRR